MKSKNQEIQKPKKLQEQEAILGALVAQMLKDNPSLNIDGNKQYRLSMGLKFIVRDNAIKGIKVLNPVFREKN